MRIACFLLVSGSVISAQTSPPEEYFSPDKSFQLSLPAGYQVHTGSDKGSKSYIPVCHPESIVCVTVPERRYAGTSFGDASVEVTVLSKFTERACLNPVKSGLANSLDNAFEIDLKNPTREINGTRFIHSSIGGAAMGHYNEDDLYRGYKNGKCYHLALSITYSNFELYPPGAVKEFSKADRKRLHAELMRIIDSFRALEFLAGLSAAPFE